MATASGSLAKLMVGASASCSATSARRRSTPSAKPSPAITSSPATAAHLRRAEPDLLVDDDHRALKYVTIIMRADNKGEGGSLACSR
jgi:hypothetical protein